MAKIDIHPKQHEITIQLTDGSKFNIMTTYGKAGETLKLDVDPKNHPAWQEGKTGFININDDRVSKFNKKFGNFDFNVSGTKVEGKKAEENKKKENKKEEDKQEENKKEENKKEKDKKKENKKEENTKEENTKEEN